MGTNCSQLNTYPKTVPYFYHPRVKAIPLTGGLAWDPDG